VNRPLAGVQQHARGERPQLQRAQVYPPLYLRVGGVEHLETAIEEEFPVPVGPHPAADGIARFEQPHRRARRGQVGRAGQSGHSGADDDDPEPGIR
jgi:hypothetical protein